MRSRMLVACVVLVGAAACAARTLADEPVALKPGVRGLVTRAVGEIKIDGKLTEWDDAFCTPVHYNHRDLLNRAGQFFYLWDDQALYIGLRALDTRQANPGQGGAVFNGDAVEFYLDTRSGNALRSKDWTPGAIHFFFSPFEGKLLRPRLVMRGGIATSNTVLSGVEHAAIAYSWGYEEELKLPWANFPEFKPELGALLAIDAELCSGDGGARTDRTFAYGSPLSVHQPASLGLVELVKSFAPEYFDQAGPASFPFWVDTPWIQSDRAAVQAVVAIPPAFIEVVGQVQIRIHDRHGKVVKTLDARPESFGPEELRFRRAIAFWSIDDFAPNTYFATAQVDARTGKTLTAVAPRMVQEANMTGR